MQQAWLAAYAHLDRFKGASAFSTWLTRIALNEGLARLRRRTGLTRVADVPEKDLENMRTVLADREAHAANRETARMVEVAVDALPEMYRSVFMLREVEGLSTAGAAACLGVSEEVIKVRLHRARLSLRDALFERAGLAAGIAFTFLGSRCDRMAAEVLEVILRDAGAA